MPVLHAIVLGIVQGFSEFLPISSSGHLNLVPWLLGWDDFTGNPGLGLTFDVALHVGTLAGAVAYFRRDLVRLAGQALAVLPVRWAPARLGLSAGAGAALERAEPSLLGGLRTRLRAHPDGRLGWLLLVSAVPVAVTGAALSSSIAGLADAEWVAGVMLVVFGLVLLWADRLGGRRPADRFRLRDALLMGVGQAVALQPGVSRSGVTMTVARCLSFDRDAAARLSFLMSLPVIAGAVLFKAVEVAAAGGIPASFVPAFFWGVVSSSVTGWLAVWGTLRLVRTHTFAPFVVYRVVLGLIVIVVAATGLR